MRHSCDVLKVRVHLVDVSSTAVRAVDESVRRLPERARLHRKIETVQTQRTVVGHRYVTKQHEQYRGRSLPTLSSSRFCNETQQTHTRYERLQTVRPTVLTKLCPEPPPSKESMPAQSKQPETSVSIVTFISGDVQSKLNLRALRVQFSSVAAAQ